MMRRADFLKTAAAMVAAPAVTSLDELPEPEPPPEKHALPEMYWVNGAVPMMEDLQPGEVTVVYITRVEDDLVGSWFHAR